MPFDDRMRPDDPMSKKREWSAGLWMSVFVLAAALLGFALISTFVCQQPGLAQQFDESGLDLQEKLAQEKAADDVAAAVVAYVERRKLSTASKIIRARVREAMDSGQVKYLCFIKELNAQLERRNVLDALGLHQRPMAALTGAQYESERALYGNRTLPAAVLATISPEAIRQGSLQDCWFLSTLAVVAKDYPFLIPAMITVNQDGQYAVHFPGEPARTVHMVRLSDLDEGRRTARTTSYGRWPEVLERAAQQVFPREMQEGGSLSVALKLLTGINAKVWALTPAPGRPSLTARGLAEVVVKALDTNEPILISTNPASAGSHQPGPFEPSHAYSIVGYKPANAQQGSRIIIRNPWGRLGFDPAQIDGLDEEGDGAFSLPATTVHNFFGSVTVASNVIVPEQPAGSGSSSSRPVGRPLPLVPHSYLQQDPNHRGSGLQTVPRSYVRP
jgi:hypothetical protein